MKDIKSLYKDAVETVLSDNALASLLHKPAELSDKLLFALGIKNAPIDTSKFDNSNLDALKKSAEKLGYDLIVVS